MRVAVRSGAVAALLAGPTVLAFFSGGYFTPAREVAGLVAWILVAVALGLRFPAGGIPAGAGPLASPRARRCPDPAVLALGGLGLYAAWMFISLLWAPIAGNAYAAAQICFAYLGVLLAAWLLFDGGLSFDRDGRAFVWLCAEPCLAVGSLIVVGYGLSGRLAPGILHFAVSVSAEGRLNQPLTYWNAMGELAAIGLVLCVRLGGDRRRAAWVRSLAVAFAAPLGLGLYVSFSRGALFACFAGLVALIVAAPTRAQLYALGLALLGAVLVSGLAAPLHGVTAMTGSHGTRDAQGLLVLGWTVIVMVLVAWAQSRLCGSVREGGRLHLPRRSGRLAAVVICLGLGVAIAVGSGQSTATPLSGGAGRLATLSSNRYQYWDVALKAFVHDPVQGVGAGGWAVWWLRDRTVPDGAQDTHSLELQTLAELGLVGAAFLLAFLGGVGWAAFRAHQADAAAAAGPLAGLVVYLAHSPLDWDWQMPALTAVALVLAGLLLAQSRSIP
jgi:hypothetical protein